MKNSFIFRKILLLLMCAIITFTGCGGGGGGVDNGDPVTSVNAKAPIITAQPQGATYTKGAVPNDLTVRAEVSEGELSYQWYKSAANSTQDGAAISGEIRDTFTPPTDKTSTVYYYVVVTNTNNASTKTATSQTARIVVNELTNAAAPIIISHPKSSDYTAGDVPTALSVTASVTDNGVLSYQWYKSAANTNEEGATVGTDSVSYTPPADTAGTAYYYVVVTNTNNAATGEKRATAKSNPAKITVSASAPSTIDAQTPTITTHPQNAIYIQENATYIQGATPAMALSVDAEVSDGGALSYQWYKSDTDVAIGGILVGTGKTYKPSISAVGTAYYYALVVNINAAATGSSSASKRSAIATIVVTPPPPVYTVKCFDDNLNILTEKYVYEDDIEPSSLVICGAGHWYLANGVSAPISYSLDSDANFYASDDITEIRTQGELDDIRRNLSGKYILISDIRLADEQAGVENGKGWRPIGDDSSNNAFKGIFNGNGHKITGLWANRSTEYFVALFGSILGATVKNLGVEIDDDKGGIIGYIGVAAIAAHIQDSSIANSYSAGNINGAGSVGGIAGLLKISSVTNSYSTANIISRGSHSSFGGIAGFAGYSSVVTGSYSAGSISGIGEIVGGIVGSCTDAGPITRNVAINPSIDGVSKVNRITGNCYGNTILNNFALSSTIIRAELGSYAGNDGTPKTDAELKIETTYSKDSGGLGWKFGTTDAAPWKIDPNKNNGYPYLYWEK